MIAKYLVTLMVTFVGLTATAKPSATTKTKAAPAADKAQACIDKHTGKSCDEVMKDCPGLMTKDQCSTMMSTAKKK